MVYQRVIKGNIEFVLHGGVVSHAFALDTGCLYDFKKANKYWDMYK